MFKKLIPILFLLTAFAAFLLVGCDDSGNTPTGGTTGGNPNIQLKAGSVFYYNTDTITVNGTIHPTSWLTKDSVQSETSYNGKTCFPIHSVTRDTSIGPIPPVIQDQTLYISYDSQTGQLNQWGVKQLFDPNQTGSWDLLADFSKMGTDVSLFTITNLFNQTFLSANVSSKVIATDTVFTTVGSGVGVKCYKVAVIADVMAAGQSIGKVYLDYFVGYTPSSNTSNPSGRIRVKLYPINLPPAYSGSGLDQKLNRFSIP